MSLTDWIAFDRELLLTLNGSESLFLDGLVKTLTTASTWIPLYLALLFLVIKNNDRLVKVLLIAGCAGLCVLLAGTIDDTFVKPTVARWRPSRDLVIGMDVDIVNGYRCGKYGFFSAHASNTFSIAVFFALLIRRRLLTFSLVLWSLVNCWTRIYLGVHFPGDILAGLLWGGICGFFVWRVYLAIQQRYFSSPSYLSSQYTATGYEYRDVNTVVAVLVYTIIYVIVKACLFLYK